MATLKEILQAAGYEPRSYSGRGMYGKECIGVTVESVQQLFQAILRAAHDNEEMDMLFDDQIFADANWDNMGRDYIVYWPNEGWTNED